MALAWWIVAGTGEWTTTEIQHGSIGVSAWSSCSSLISADAPWVLGWRARGGGIHQKHQRQRSLKAKSPNKYAVFGAANRHNNSRVSETKRLVKQAACRLIAALSHSWSSLRQKFHWSEDKVGGIVLEKIVPVYKVTAVRNQVATTMRQRFTTTGANLQNLQANNVLMFSGSFCAETVSHNLTPLAVVGQLPHY